jgi:energy-coupling factor transporter ATP-binding protein EcfA2
MARHFSNWVRAYLQFTEFSEPPEVFNYWVAVSTIAGALQGKCYFDQGLFEWTPHFYTLLIGPSGSGKTTAINAGMKLLKQVKGVHIGSDSLTWQSMVDEFLDAAAGGTGIRSRGGMRKHSSITYCPGELGTFLDPRDKKLMSALTHLWAGDGGDDFKRRTRTDGGRVVERPFLNLIAGATPAWITDNLPPSLIGTGFTSRCILVYAEQKKQIIAYPRRSAAEQGAGDMGEMARLLTEDLGRIAKLQGGFTLSEQAYELGTTWYTQFSRQPPVGLSPDDFGGYLNRRQAHAHKLAMTISAAESDDMVVSGRHLEEAITMLSSTEKAMPTAISGMHDELRPALRIEETLRRYGSVPTVELYQRFRNKMDWRTFCQILHQLEEAGLTAEVTTQHGKAVRWLGASPKDSRPS